jgi:hypothetical protein
MQGEAFDAAGADSIASDEQALIGGLPAAGDHFHWGLDADDPEQGVLTIVGTSIHPSWWECPLCQQPTRQGSADIAVIEIAEDTPDIPEATIELNRVEPGAQVVKVGWGCEETTNVDPTTLELGRYKTDDAAVIATSEITSDSG